MAIALIIPLSVLTALTILQFLDVTINILSLGGLALGMASCGQRDRGGRSDRTPWRSRDWRHRRRHPCHRGGLGDADRGDPTTVLVFGRSCSCRSARRSSATFAQRSGDATTSLVLAPTLMPVMMVRWRGRGRDRGQDPASRPGLDFLPSPAATERRGMKAMKWRSPIPA
jgi:hypothetical protein